MDITPVMSFRIAVIPDFEDLHFLDYTLQNKYIITIIIIHNSLLIVISLYHYVVT